MPKTAEQKKQQENQRQEALLELATEIHTGKPIKMCDVVLIYERVRKLMSVTKISNENAIKYLNKAMIAGGDYHGEPIAQFSWDDCGKVIMSRTREKCSCCDTIFKMMDGHKLYVKHDDQNPFDSDDGIGTSLIGTRWYVDKEKLVDWEKGPNGFPVTIKLGLKKTYGKCKKCTEPTMGEMNADGHVLINREDIDKFRAEGMERWDHYGGRLYPEGER